MEILNVKNLNLTYPECENNALCDICFSLEKGDFAVLCGKTGSGKTSLLRMLKPSLSPRGDKSGEIIFENENIYDEDFGSDLKIGFVMQNPDQQIVTDKVWHELAFALENQNLKKDEIGIRIAEAAQFFGLTELFDKRTDSLSGGQKQLLNLASVAVMKPDLLILDEPTAQLDPVSAAEFITVLTKLNSEMGITVLISEHRLDELLSLSTKLILMDSGKVVFSLPTREALKRISDENDIQSLFPVCVRLYSRFPVGEKIPLTVNEAKSFVSNNFKNTIKDYDFENEAKNERKALEFDNVSFRYTKNSEDVLEKFSLSVFENEIFCILGANGSGKTTAMNIAAGLIKPYEGNVKVFGKRIKDYRNNSLYINCLSLLPQDVQTVFLRNTVKEELDDCKSVCSFPFDLSYLLDRHPYDISGGEQQLLALAKVLSNDPKLIILDEPTKGLDGNAKERLIKIIKELKKCGKTVLIVTHDVDFAAEIADRCAFLFNGKTVSADFAHRFFENNSFYTGTVNRIASGFYNNVIKFDELCEMIVKNTEN